MNSMEKQVFSYERGFTLVELLVVIAIASFLAAIILTSVRSVRAKARDTRRKQDLAEIYKAIELYINDMGIPPPMINEAGICNFFCMSNIDIAPWISGLMPNYMNKLPVDPLNNRFYNYRYKVSDSGVDYELDTAMEIDYKAAINDGGNANNCATIKPYQLCRYEIGSDLALLDIYLTMNFYRRIVVFNEYGSKRHSF